VSILKSRPKLTIADAILKLDTQPEISYGEIKVASMTDFDVKKKGIVDGIVRDYMSNKNKDLNSAIAEIAKANNFNENEILRIIQSVNMAVYQELYERSFGGMERKVQFDIASPEKIMPSVKPTEGPVVDENNEKVAMEKTASLNEIIAGVDMDIPTKYSAPVIPGFYDHFIAGKVAADLASTEESLEKAAAELNDTIEKIATALAIYSTKGIDVQAVFEKLASRAGIRKLKQADIIEVYNRACSNEKIASDVKLELVDIDAIEDFSLGKHSISKIAEEATLMLPEVSAKRSEIKNFEKLVELALKIQGNEELRNELLNSLELKKEIIASPSMNENQGGLS
jgi:hypothetical protein